jgi:hypothetical protein
MPDDSRIVLIVEAQLLRRNSNVPAAVRAHWLRNGLLARS